MPCRRLVYFFPALLVLIFAACRSPSSARPPDYLVVGIESYPLQLDPRYATDANAVRIGNLIYNSLLRADQHTRLQPELAAGWRMIDATTYVFDLRHDVKFSDGRPLTAADVKFTYESMLDLKNRSPKRGLLKPLRAIEQSGAYQLRFHLAAPHAPFVEQFTQGIVPADSVAEGATNYQSPAGSGPFRLQAVEPGEKVTLQRNPYYWDERPPLPGVVFKIVPDALVRVLEFEKGNIDFMQNDLEPDMLPWLKNNSAADVAAYAGTTFQYIGINLTHPILKNVKVRRALAYAIDRESLVRHLLKDTANRRQRRSFAAQLGLRRPRVRAGPTTQTEPSNCSMKPAFLIPTATALCHVFVFRSKPPTSIYAGASPRRSRNSCNRWASNWKSVAMNGALFTAT